MKYCYKINKLEDNICVFQTANSRLSHDCLKSNE